MWIAVFWLFSEKTPEGNNIGLYFPKVLLENKENGFPQPSGNLRMTKSRWKYNKKSWWNSISWKVKSNKLALTVNSSLKTKLEKVQLFLFIFHRALSHRKDRGSKSGFSRKLDNTIWKRKDLCTTVPLKGGTEILSYILLHCLLLHWATYEPFYLK